MGLFQEVFAWWTGTTWGTRWTIARRGKQVGSDAFGNTYYLDTSGRPGPTGKPRRWVVYSDISEPSLVPPGWHGWLHYVTDDLPDDQSIQPREWELPHKPNLTGTVGAYRPPGSILTPEQRPDVTGDYDAWRPGQS